MTAVRTIEVRDYDPSWPATFASLRDHVAAALAGLEFRIEHVGSTSVPGLAAKPVIDLDVVVPSKSDVPPVITRLAALGYEHLGNLGIEGREAFTRPAGLPAHNLYLCWEGSLGLRNHLAVRDYLRSHPDVAREYGDLKKQLAADFPHDIDSYVDGKTDMIVDILRAKGMAGDDLAVVEAGNRTTR